MSEMMESLLGLLILIIGLFVYFYYFSTFGKYRRWLKKNTGKSNYNDVIIRDILKDIDITTSINSSFRIANISTLSSSIK